MKKISVLALAALFFTGNIMAQKAKPAPVKHLKVDTAKFAMVDGGSFKMGTNQPVEQHEGPEHNVTVNSFYIGKTEVTFADYDTYTHATGQDSLPSGTWGRGQHPVFMVTWLDAVKYCNWLSEQQHLSKYYLIKGNHVSIIDTGKGYRLPTEAEWEFAARGGNKSKGTTYAGGNDMNAVGWFKDNAGGQTHQVAQKAPNELGLYDMCGNVWEWVWDIYDWNYYKVSPQNNPNGPATGPYRVMRGGAWFNDVLHTKTVSRQNAGPDFRQNSVGFRVAITWF